MCSSSITARRREKVDLGVQKFGEAGPLDVTTLSEVTDITVSIYRGCYFGQNETEKLGDLMYWSHMKTI